MTVLAVAALSARMLAEAARADGFDVIAFDVFGDADTRRACSQWLPIGAPDGLRIDAALLLSVLGALAQRGDVIGWIAGRPAAIVTFLDGMSTRRPIRIHHFRAPGRAMAA